MSLILDALKKSEAERRVGQPPGLLSQAAPTPAPRQSPWPWLGLLLSVPLLVAGAWWFGRSYAPAPLPAPVAVDSPSVPAPAEKDVPTAPAEAHSPPPSQPASRPASLPAAPRPALRQPPPRQPEQGTMERESLPMLAPEAEAKLPGGPTPPPASADVPVATLQVLPALPAAPVPVEASPGNDVPALRDLSASLRADLPPLRVSMHVFDADPTRRFVLIDGRRMIEGGRIDADLELVEIRRDGSVLTFRGQRFLLPRP